MIDADLVLGKRPAADQEEESQNRTRSIVSREESELEGKTKKGRCEAEVGGRGKVHKTSRQPALGPLVN
jgi:hypothetical protein